MSWCRVCRVFPGFPPYEGDHFQNPKKPGETLHTLHRQEFPSAASWLLVCLDGHFVQVGGYTPTLHRFPKPPVTRCPGKPCPSSRASSQSVGSLRCQTGWHSRRCQTGSLCTIPCRRCRGLLL